MSVSKDDEEMLRQLVAMRQNIYAHCYRMLRNAAEAEDAAQEVLVSAIKSIPAYRPDNPLTHWVSRITTNYCLNVLRQKQRTISYNDPDKEFLTDIEALPSLDMQEAERRICHTQLIEEIMERAKCFKPPWDADDYLIFETYFRGEKLSWVQVAQILDMPVSTVKTRYSTRIQPVLDKIRQEDEAGGRRVKA